MPESRYHILERLKAVERIYYLITLKNLSIMTTTDTTMFKYFDNWSQFDEKTRGYNVYAQLTNGRCVEVHKSALKKVAASMQNNDEPFYGKITYSSGGHKYVQVTFLK